MDPFVSQIYLFAGNFPIYGFAQCSGQILPISQYTALFSLIGTYYGGNGTSNFQLPDLRGRTAVGQGQGPGLSDYVVGEILGAENETMLASNIPAHRHTINAVANSGSVALPSTCYMSEVKTGSGPHGSTELFYNAGPANTALSPNAITVNIGGGSTPFNIQQPYLCITPLIALAGIFPTRN